MIVVHDTDMPVEDKWEAITMLERKIEDCQREEAESKKAASDARYDVEGETLRTTHWTRTAKGYHPRQVIHEFKVEADLNSSTTRFENRPKHIARMARDYHDSIQRKDLPEEYGRMMATQIVLEQCHVHLSESEFQKLDKSLTEDNIRNALKLSKNGRAPGLDGIPYEFFRILDITYKRTKGSEQETFNVINFLTKLYTHIEDHGITKGTNFNQG